MSKEKKNRFYYSFSQECISQKMGEIDDMFNKIEGVRENYVLTPNGWEKYTEWCSQKGSKCNWGDAKLIFETNDSPEIKIEYRKTTQLAAKELELILVKNQLKEKEEEELEKNDNEWRKICDGKLETINRLIEKNHKLQQKLDEEKNRSKKLNHEAQKYYEDAYCNGFQNKKAIAELEKLNEKFNQPYSDDVYTGGQIENIIKEQIKSLKGEK